MSILADLDHCKLEAIFPEDDDSKQVLHYEYSLEDSRGLQKVRVEKRWRRQQCLGRGSYGDVWLEVMEDEPSMKRAVKAIRMKEMGVDVDYTKEVKAMVEFSKAKYRQEELFVHFLGWFDNTKTDTVFLAMEYFPLGDLESHMTEEFSEPEVKEISTQLMHGLKTMHAEGFTHRDLKPANIFVVQNSPSWRVKLGDFGISKCIQGSATALRTMIGTCDYMAPEFFDMVEDDNIDEESSAYTIAVDLWAVGCIIFKLFTQQVPFPSRENLKPLKKYCWGENPFPEDILKANGLGRVAVEFLLRLLEPRPSCRLTAEAALKTAWLNSVESELSLVSRPLSIPLQGQPAKEPIMVKNYGPKYPPSHKKEVVQQARSDLYPGLVTGTEWGFLDASDTSLPNSNSMAEESGVTSSGEESDISQDVPADYTARKTVRYKREYKKKRRKEASQMMPVWYDRAWVYPKYWPDKPKAKPVVAKDETKGTDTTIKPINLFEQALTIRMPKIAPAKRLLDCPLSRNCSLSDSHGFETQQLLDKHLVEGHRDWKKTLRQWEKMGIVDQRTVKPYDCPLSFECSRRHKEGFENEEEVVRHLDVQHGYKDPPKEGDLLLPHLRLG